MKAWLFSPYLWGILLVGGGSAWYAKSKWHEHDPKPVVGKVERMDLRQRSSFSGVVEPLRKTKITPAYPGYVQHIFVQIGQMVKVNDPVVTVTQSGRTDEAFPMRAPFGGTVVQILRNEGEYVEGNKEGAVVRIDDLSGLNIKADVPEIDYPKLRVGQVATIRPTSMPDHHYQGKITALAQASKETANAYERAKAEFPVTIAVDAPDELLRPGMSVTVDVTTRLVPKALTLRHEYIHRDDKEMFVILEDGTRRKVDVGLQTEEAFEVKGGVTEGDSVRQVDYSAAEPSPDAARR